MFDWLTHSEMWIALGTLTALEIVLGVDNIIFISILVGQLPQHQRNLARRLGLGLAMATRLGLLFSISLMMELTAPLFSVLNQAISGRDLILIIGGLFLLTKATHEIHNSLEGPNEQGLSAFNRPWNDAGPDRSAGYRLLIGFRHHCGRVGR